MLNRFGFVKLQIVESSFFMLKKLIGLHCYGCHPKASFLWRRCFSQKYIDGGFYWDRIDARKFFFSYNDTNRKNITAIMILQCADRVRDN